MDTQAISKALIAWMDSQGISAADAVVAMLTVTASSIASGADTPAKLAGMISEAESLLVRHALGAWLEKRGHKD
jgi:hypothetical protein